MASLKELFNVEGLASQEAKALVIETQAKELQEFIKGLRKRKAQVYTELLKVSVVTFESVITLSSLLLQANLYCRKTQSMLLLKQIFAEELAEAIASFYRADYTPVAEYLSFIKQIFNLI